MKLNFKERKKQAKGITLIALVITIIVLLILAGVTITTLTGEEGILNQASESKIEQEKARCKESVDLAVITLVTDTLSNGKSITEITPKMLLEEVKKNEGDQNIWYENNDGKYASTDVQSFTADVKFPGKVVFGADTTSIKQIIKVSVNIEGNNLKVGNAETENSSTPEVDNSEPVATSEDCFEFDTDKKGIRLKKAANYYDRGGLHYTLKDSLGLDSKTIVVPSTYKGDTVKKIGVVDEEIPDAFGYRNAEFGINAGDVEKIYIPNSVTEIGNCAFYGCRALKEIYLPGGLTTINTSRIGNSDTKIYVRCNREDGGYIIEKLDQYNDLIFANDPGYKEYQ